MQKILENDLIQALSHLSHGHKLLYRILWELADEVGVVEFDIGMISDASGIKYHESDFDAFGKRVVRFSATTLFLPLYLTRHIRTFDPNNPGQKRIWRRLKERWGATKEHMEPFYSLCQDKGVLNLLPKFPDYHVDENGIKPWLLEYQQGLKMAATVDTPYGWPESVDSAFKSYMKSRIEKCEKIITKSDRNRNILQVDNVLALQRTIGLFLQSGYSDFQITKAIIDSEANNWPTFKIYEKPANAPKHT
jgi:hypothetical protein